MFTTKTRQRGFTLVELIIFIVVVGVGLLGILQVTNTVVKSSADPMVRKQAVALADSILEEILQKEYTDPVGGYTGVDRSQFDDVDDYKNKTPAQLQALFADSLAPIPGYTISIVVGNEAALSGVSMKKITVTVGRGSESVALSGYRANFCPTPASCP